jgi:hypothetical protein
MITEDPCDHMNVCLQVMLLPNCAHLGCKAILMSITADARDSIDAEVKRCDWEPCLLEEGHDEAAEAAVDVQPDVALLRELAERDDVVLAPVGEVHCGADDLESS